MSTIQGPLPYVFLRSSCLWVVYHSVSLRFLSAQAVKLFSDFVFPFFCQTSTGVYSVCAEGDVAILDSSSIDLISRSLLCAE